MSLENLALAMEDVETWGGWTASVFSPRNMAFVNLVHEVGKLIDTDMTTKMNTEALNAKLPTLETMVGDPIICKAFSTLLLAAAQERSHATKPAEFDEISKFGDMAEANFGDTAAFFTGLDGLIGPPNLDLQAGIYEEHNNDDFFTAPNYGVTTCPREEWRYVFGDGQEPSHKGTEKTPRSYRNLDELYANALDEINEARKSASLPLVTQDELAAVGLLKEELGCLRLYTGPMFVKYNTALRERGQGKHVNNTYTTTIQLISSGLIKLSRLQPAVSLYRGFGGGRLKMPSRFFVPDEKLNTIGGVEFAFMSCTRNREVALQYSGGGYLLSLATGLTTRGADLSWISFYPHEQEVCLPPCTALEVVGKSRSIGAVVVMDLKLIANPAAATIEKFLQQRKNVVLELSDISCQSAPAESASQVVLTTHKDTLSENHYPWFNAPENFSSALQGLLDLSKAGQQRGDSREGMLLFSLKARSTQAITALCEQGADITSTKHSPEGTSGFHLCATENFGEGVELMLASSILNQLDLTKLDLGDVLTEQCKTGASQGLVQYVASHPESITTLRAGLLKLGQERASHVLKGVCDLAGRLLLLSELDLSHMLLGNDQTLALLTDAITSASQLPALSSLKLGGNEITDVAAITALCVACEARSVVLGVDANAELGQWLAADSQSRPTSFVTSHTMTTFEAALLGAMLGALEAVELNLDASADHLDVVSLIVEAHTCRGSPSLKLQRLVAQGNCVGDSGAMAVAGCATLGSALHHLHLPHNRIASDGLNAIATSDTFTALQSMDLRDNTLTDTSAVVAVVARCAQRGISLRCSEANADLAAWLATPTEQRSTVLRTSAVLIQRDAVVLGASLHALEEVHVAGGNLRQLKDVWEGHSLGGSQPLKLHTLHIPNNGLCDEGVVVLTNVAGMQWASLDLSDNGISDEGVQTLAASSQIANLKSLALASNRISAVGATSLATSEHLASLNHLDLSNNNLGNAGLTALVASASVLTALTSLNVAWNGLGETALAELLTSAVAANLTHLNVEGNSLGAEAVGSAWTCAGLVSLNAARCGLGDDGATALASNAAALSNLTNLQLAANSISSVGVVAVIESPHLSKLTALDLSNNIVGVDGASALAKSGFLPSVATLLLECCHLTADGAAALFGSDLRSLTNLNVSGNGLGAEGAQHLAAAAENAPNLVTLALANNGLGRDGAAAVASSAVLAKVASLDLSNNGIGAEGAKALADSPHLRSVTSLALDGCAIGATGTAALSASENLRNVTHLRLHANAVGTAGARAIAESTVLGAVQSLDLSNNGLGIEGTDLLVNSASLRNVTTLNLARNGFGAEGMRALAASEHLRRVTTLNVEGNHIADAGLEALTSSPHAWNLVHLHAGDNAIADKGAIALASWSGLVTPRTLSLASNYVGEPGAKALAACPSMHSLTTLDLNLNCIEASGAAALASSEYLTGLKSLRVNKCKLGAQGVQTLAESPALAQLTDLDVGENRLNSDCVAALSASTSLRGLRSLLMSRCSLSAADTRAILTSPISQSVSELVLALNDTQDGELIAFDEAPSLARVRRIALNSSGSKAATIKAIATSATPAKHLEHAILSSCTLDTEAVGYITSTPALSSLTHLDVSGSYLTAEDAVSLVLCPSLRFVTNLNLSDNSLSDDVAKALASPECKMALVTLGLKTAYIKTEGIQALADSPNMRTVTSLDLYRNELKDEGLSALAASKYLTSLTHLDLDNTSFTEAGFTAIGESRALKRALTSLSFGGETVKGDAISVLLGVALEGQDAPAAPAPPLIRLELESLYFGDDGMRALAKSPSLQTLTRLRLDRNAITVEGVRAFVESPHLGSLYSLSIAVNAINAEGIALIANAPALSGLVELNISGNFIGPQGIAAVANSKYMRSLEFLGTNGGRIGTAGVKAITSSPYLTNLASLNLGGNEIDSAGVRLIVECKNLWNLKFLELGYNNIDMEGARQFAGTRNFTRFTYLNLSRNKFAQDGVKLLRGCQQYWNALTV